VSDAAGRPSVTLLLVRHVLPALVVLAGIVIFLADRSILAAEGSAGLVGAGLAWWLFGWLFRKGVEGDADRDEEDAARTFLDEHGRWPTDAETGHFRRHGRWPA
jgi:predicted AlkP superfamily pyrophosphatase or phosphodiesterase